MCGFRFWVQLVCGLLDELRQNLAWHCIRMAACIRTPANRESVEHVLYRHPQEARTPKAPNPETQQLCARHPDLNPSSEAPTARFMILCPFLIYTSPLHQSQCFTNILSICLCSPATRQAGPAQGGVWKFGDTVSGSYNRGSETFLSGSRDSVSMPGNHSVVFRVQGK